MKVCFNVPESTMERLEELNIEELTDAKMRLNRDMLIWVAKEATAGHSPNSHILVGAALAIQLINQTIQEKLSKKTRKRKPKKGGKK